MKKILITLLFYSSISFTADLQKRHVISEKDSEEKLDKDSNEIISKWYDELIKDENSSQYTNRISLYLSGIAKNISEIESYMLFLWQSFNDQAKKIIEEAKKISKNNKISLSEFSKFIDDKSGLS